MLRVLIGLNFSFFPFFIFATMNNIRSKKLNMIFITASKNRGNGGVAT